MAIAITELLVNYQTCNDYNMINIKSKITAILAVSLLTAGGLASQASAAQVNGAITLAGGAKFDTNSLASATRVNAFSNVSVKSLDGDFAGFVNVDDPVSMATPWIFSPSTPTPGLWSVGGFTYDLDSATVVLQTADFLLITGTGTISGNGFDPTPGMWSFTSQSPSANGIFSFSAGDQFNGVPDGGTTASLLGIGLVAVGLLRRRLATA